MSTLPHHLKLPGGSEYEGHNYLFVHSDLIYQVFIPPTKEWGGEPDVKVRYLYGIDEEACGWEILPGAHGHPHDLIKKFAEHHNTVWE